MRPRKAPRLLRRDLRRALGDNFAAADAASISRHCEERSDAAIHRPALPKYTP